MNNKFLAVLGFASLMLLSVADVNATTQNPSYTDDLGSFHYMSAGGYSNFSDFANTVESNAINDATNKFTNKKRNFEENVNSTVESIEDNVRPAKSNKFSDYSFKRGSMNSSDSTLEEGFSGVNSSKTMYKDGIGRLHFFGKGNIIKE